MGVLAVVVAAAQLVKPMPRGWEQAGKAMQAAMASRLILLRIELPAEVVVLVVLADLARLDLRARQALALLLTG